MNTGEFLIRQAWLILAAFTALQFWPRPRFVRERARDDKEFDVRDRELRRNSFGLTLLPWLVMALGMNLGGPARLGDFLRPSSDPWIVFFFSTIFLVWAVTWWWVFFRDGMRLVEEHGLWGKKKSRLSPAFTRLTYLFFFAMNIALLAALVFFMFSA